MEVLDAQPQSEPQSLIIQQEEKIDVYEDGFVRLNSVTTTTATPEHVMFDNITKNSKKGIPFLHQMPYFKQVKDKNERIAIVGGGPSLKDNLEELKKFNVIIAAGSVHDYLVENGIVPSFATACDPDPITANYFSKPMNNTTYLIATGCDEKVFEVLQGKNIVVWHCYSDASREKFLELDPNFQAVGGGCTVGLRSISIAIMLGYTNLNFFGFDSCLGYNSEHHAYGFTDESEYAGLGTIYKMRLGEDKPTSRTYEVAGYQLAQARHYQQFWETYGNMFTATFYGEGLLPELAKMMEDHKQRTLNL